ncbi:MAG: hypothetical protein CL917_15660 [Deltaproteobacteria bacterium]|nr:hypothetical protein [Deltaproteobacteria bacterium]
MNPREIYSSRLGEVVLFKVSRLGYLVLEVSDFPAWEYFGTEILGLMAEKNGSGDALCLRMDGQAQRFRLESGPADDLICLGFEVESEAALEGLAKQLSAGGHAIQECDSETATSRGVPRLFRTNDPSGLEVEFFYDIQESKVPFVSEFVPGGFVTGNEGLGHVVLNARDHNETEKFYRDLLGMRLSDRIAMRIGPDVSLDTDFYHVNSRHHTLAFAESGLPKKMHHFMIEAREMDAVGQAYDRVLASDLRIINTLGRHSNDKMFSFYVRTPSRFEVEFGWGGVKVDEETWEVEHYDRGSLWGHHRPPRPTGQ